MIKVLHVDDEIDELTLLQSFFEKQTEEVKVVSIRSAISALAQIQTEKYDCIVSDYNMPGMDGLEFLKSVRRLGISIPFIFLSGQGNEKVIGQAYRHGADDYIAKNLNSSFYDDLYSCISDHTCRKAGFRQLYELHKLNIDALAKPEVQDYLEIFLQAISIALDLEHGIIAKVTGEEMLSEICLTSGMGRVDNFSFGINNSPCNEVVDSARSFIREFAPVFFPECDLLNRFGANHFIGVPLLNGDGCPSGILVMLHNRSIRNVEHIVSVLEELGPFLQAELDRLPGGENSMAC